MRGGWVDGRTDGWMDRQVGREIDGQVMEG